MSQQPIAQATKDRWPTRSEAEQLCREHHCRLGHRWERAGSFDRCVDCRKRAKDRGFAAAYSDHPGAWSAKHPPCRPTVRP